MELIKTRIFALIMYGLLFLLTTVFAYLATVFKKQKEKLPMIFFSFLAIFLPCLFAGLRADTVGTDIMVYAKPVFLAAKSTNLSQLMRIFDIEAGYLLLAIFSAKLFSSFPVFLFLTELLCILPVYIVAYKRDKYSPMWLTVLVYLLIFYCATFNFMRQSIAAACMILAYQEYEEGKKIKALILLIIGYFFHMSILIGVAMYAAVILILKIKIKKNTAYYFMFIAAAALVFGALLINLNVLANLFSISSSITDKYSFYFNIFESSNTSSSLFVMNFHYCAELVFRIIFVILVLYLSKFKNCFASHNDRVNFYVLEFVLGEIIYIGVFFLLHSAYGIRIIWFSEWILLLIAPIGISSSASKKTGKLQVTKTRLMWLNVIGLYFVLGFVGIGWHGIMPLAFRV